MDRGGGNTLAAIVDRRMRELAITSDAELARRADIPKHAIASIRAGNTPRIGTLIALACALEQPVVSLVYAAAGHEDVPPGERPVALLDGSAHLSRALEDLIAAAARAFEWTAGADRRPTPARFGRYVVETVRLLADMESGPSPGPTTGPTPGTTRASGGDGPA